MSENDQQPPAPQLTRRQLRELRNTASTPIITDPPEPADEGGSTSAESEQAPAVVAPLPRAAEPTVVPEAPDASVDLGAPALTRRQARLQEKIRTASVPIITPDLPHGNDGDPDFGAGRTDADLAPEAVEHEAVEHEAVEPEAVEPAESVSEEPAQTQADEPTPETGERHVVSEDLGAGILSGESVEAELPASFDQLISRSAAATGAFTAPNALILTQSPDAGPLVAPVTATGEVLITGTFTLPDRFGSTGVVPGSADGKDVDAVLIDGELPASSSPTPIAASAAISTIKSAEDVIRPPAPEKGSRLVLIAAITAGILALTLAGLLIYTFTTGVFS